MIKLKDILFEVGEGSATPFQFNRKGNFGSFFKSLKSSATINKYTPHKDFVYEIIGDKARYLVKFRCILKKKNTMVLRLPGDDYEPTNVKYQMIVSVSFNVKGAKGEHETGLGEIYRLMSTVIETVTDFIKGLDDDIKIESIHIYPKADESGNDSDIDSKRGRIYLAYINKNIGKLPGKWASFKYTDRVELKDMLNESTKTEYIIWGVPPGKKDEQILFTKAKSMGEAKKVIETLTQKHGCKKCRVQTIDLSQDTDFSQEFGKAIK